MAPPRTGLLSLAVLRSHPSIFLASKANGSKSAEMAGSLQCLCYGVTVVDEKSLISDYLGITSAYYSMLSL